MKIIVHGEIHKNKYYIENEEYETIEKFSRRVINSSFYPYNKISSYEIYLHELYCLNERISKLKKYLKNGIINSSLNYNFHSLIPHYRYYGYNKNLLEGYLNLYYTKEYSNGNIIYDDYKIKDAMLTSILQGHTGIEFNFPQQKNRRKIGYVVGSEIIEDKILNLYTNYIIEVIDDLSSIENCENEIKKLLSKYEERKIIVTKLIENINKEEKTVKFTEETFFNKLMKWSKK